MGLGLGGFKGSWGLDNFLGWELLLEGPLRLCLHSGLRQDGRLSAWLFPAGANIALVCCGLPAPDLWSRPPALHAAVSRLTAFVGISIRLVATMSNRLPLTGKPEAGSICDVRGLKEELS